uniref:Uncharacterized protein n=1 Tax=Arundo donax TaxID=35708 RepID=A0A0A9B2D7_ARUDO
MVCVGLIRTCVKQRGAPRSWTL